MNNKLPEIKYNHTNYEAFLESFAAAMHVKHEGFHIAIPAVYGEGFMWAKNLPDGISVLVSDKVFYEDLTLQRTGSASQFFILQFYDVTSAGSNRFIADEKKLNAYFIQQSVTMLTNSVKPYKYVFPAGMRTRTVRFIFEKRHLLEFFDNDTINFIVSNYFTNQLKSGKYDMIDADYRNLMNELIKEKIEQPLEVHFIQNRVMLLLERFLKKTIEKQEATATNVKFTEDEISRLMRAEALLVKDFSTDPPTISILSRVAAMSPTKLKMDFKALFGLPVFEYFQKHRMQHARILLLENKYTIKQVGNMVGYTNLGHFAGSFKKAFNMLPSDISATHELKEDELIYQTKL